MEYKWRIGASESEMLYMVQIGIPIPNEPVYKPYTKVLPVDLGSNKTSGYKNVTLSWSTMTSKGLNQLKSYIDPVRTSGDEIYLTIQRAEGETWGDDWIDVRGYPHEIEFQKVGGKAIGHAYRNIVLFVNNLTIVNDPSTAV